MNTFVQERRIVTLGDICNAETWLHIKECDGLQLQYVQDSVFVFRPTIPNDAYYFILNTETGNNSSLWIYFEFLRAGAQKVAFRGAGFTCPRYILRINKSKYDKNKLLFDYLYQHRNHLLLKRIIRNVIISGLFCICFFLLGFIQRFSIAITLFALVAGIICLTNCISLNTLWKSFRVAETPIPFKRPRRPGY